MASHRRNELNHSTKLIYGCDTTLISPKTRPIIVFFLSFFLFKPFLGRVVSDLSVGFLGRARTGLGLEPGTSSSSSGRALGNHRRAGSTRIGEIRGNYCTQRDEIAAVFFGRDDRGSASFIFCSDGFFLLLSIWERQCLTLLQLQLLAGTCVTVSVGLWLLIRKGNPVSGCRQFLDLGRDSNMVLLSSSSTVWIRHILACMG